MKIAIALPCYKRTSTLSELGKTLLDADYGNDSVDIIFSIDYSGSDDVAHFAESFKWPFGEKVIKKHEQNIGLRQNILYCGDLTSRYDAVIVIEDDLEVSPSFYRFAKQAAEFYNNEDSIGGISIYAYRIEEISKTEFHPYTEGFDAYFVQWASSWGQLWTRNQWNAFRKWYSEEKDISGINIPWQVKSWKRSWKKFYIAYLVDTGRYFAFPFLSFVYNGNKTGGTHSDANRFEVLTSSPLDYSVRDFRFLPFQKAVYKYDAFFQLQLSDIKINGTDYNIEFDLFGHKQNPTAPFTITSRKCPSDIIIESFDAGMLPLEQNIIENRRGNIFNLIETKNFGKTKKVPLKSYSHIRRRIISCVSMLSMGFLALYIKLKEVTGN